MSCNNNFARYRSTAPLRSSGFTRASRSSCRSQLHCRPTSGIGSLWTIFLLVCGAAPIASEHQVAADVRVALTTQWPVCYPNTTTFQSTFISDLQRSSFGTGTMSKSLKINPSNRRRQLQFFRRRPNFLQMSIITNTGFLSSHGLRATLKVANSTSSMSPRISPTLVIVLMYFSLPSGSGNTLPGYNSFVLSLWRATLLQFCALQMRSMNRYPAAGLSLAWPIVWPRQPKSFITCWSLHPN